MPAIYRMWQFVQAARASIRPADAEDVRGYLTPAALSLFEAMPRYDQQHGRHVLQALRERGHGDPGLLAAALLHDVGKTADRRGRLRLWHRVAVVLMRAWWPGLLGSIGQNRPGSWRHPFFVQQQHAAIGAEHARQAGCLPRTVELIRRHEEKGETIDDPLLAALQAADNAS
jgi:putative nucleotidyltransferase with HDIG domain